MQMMKIAIELYSS